MLEHDFQCRFTVLKGFAEVAMQRNILEENDVLGKQRLIEAHLVPHNRDVLLGGVIGHHNADWIAGEMNKQEHKN
jgi:hypothetical protein